MLIYLSIIQYKKRKNLYQYIIIYDLSFQIDKAAVFVICLVWLELQYW